MKLLPKTLAAFTYIELLMVLGIIGILLSISVLSVGPVISRTTLEEQSQMLLTDVQSMQLKSMRRERGDAAQTTPFGIYFQSGGYVLFQGTVFDPNAAENVVVDLPEDYAFSTISVPSNSVVFERGSGAVTGYNPSTSTVVLTQISTGTSIVLQLNRNGVAEVIK